MVNLEKLSKNRIMEMCFESFVELSICKIKIKRIVRTLGSVSQLFVKKVDLELCVKILDQVKNNPHVDETLLIIYFVL